MSLPDDAWDIQLDWYALNLHELRFNTYSQYEVGDEIQFSIEVNGVDTEDTFEYIFKGYVTKVQLDENTKIYQVVARHVIQEILEEPMVEPSLWANDTVWNGNLSSILENNLGIEYDLATDFYVENWHPNPTVKWVEYLQFLFYKILNWNVWIHYDGEKYILKEYPDESAIWAEFTWDDWYSEKHVEDAKLSIRYRTKTYNWIVPMKFIEDMNRWLYEPIEIGGIGMAIPIPHHYGNYELISQFIKYRKPQNIYFDVTYQTNNFLAPQSQWFGTPLTGYIKAATIHQQFIIDRKVNYVELQGWF